MDQIIPRLWLGDVNDGVTANKAGWPVLSVMWKGEPMNDGSWKQIQTTDYKMFSEYNGVVIEAEGVWADPPRMDEAADWIQEHINEGKDVLVHCAFGVERSPLTVVWYLMRHKHMNLSAAYDLVIEKHPQTQYRGAWLPREVRLSGVLTKEA